jgi:adenine-specific DNA-methyltransferase
MPKRKPSARSKADKQPLEIQSFTHESDKRRNIPTAELQAVVQANHLQPISLRYPRNTDLDPQFVWRGKDNQDWSDLVVHAPPLYIQEKVHPKALIDDLIQETRRSDQPDQAPRQLDLFDDFNGIPKEADKTEFYQHDQNWTNRMILGDSLQVMASLAERERLRGKVQCIYFDPPYGIKFNSNFQWSTTSRDVKDGKAEHITREPEQVKAFRDTWRDGIHSYLTYLRDRLTVARDLLTDSGSIFVQIGDENVHRVRAVLDEVFGEGNFDAIITVRKTGGLGSTGLTGVADFILWYTKNRESAKRRSLYIRKEDSGTDSQYSYAFLEDGTTIPMSKIPEGVIAKQFQPTAVHTMYAGVQSCLYPVFDADGKTFRLPTNRQWSTTLPNMRRIHQAGRLYTKGNTPRFIRMLFDHPVTELTNLWTDVMGAKDVVYVVQTNERIIERCILMSTDPGDLVLDPTCGSGTTAYVAEQWGRRWITIDTSRVALALARARLMGARYPYYLLADSKEGQAKEAEVSARAPSSQPTYGNLRLGFVYQRVPHITLKSIANNSEIDVLWDKWQKTLQPLLDQLNATLKTKWQEWEVPREPDAKWSTNATELHRQWWDARIARQKEIDRSIAAKADYEYLYDKPYEDKRKVRVAGPFTVESLSPHRMLSLDEDGKVFDESARERQQPYAARQTFPQMILEALRVAGVQQAHKDQRITFDHVEPWPGQLICGDGRYQEGDLPRRAAIFIGPEFGTVQRADLVDAANEAAEAKFDVLISCAFHYEARTTELSNVGKMPILKARMNADLHMAEDLKNTGKGNLFVVFGEPDIRLESQADGNYIVEILGIDIFQPSTGEVRSDGPEGIACWFLDTDYNGESFFVRHAYFLGQNDPYSALKTTLKTEIDTDAWSSLHRTRSRPFPAPLHRRIAIKVINHLGDEVMKVFRV